MPQCEYTHRAAVCVVPDAPQIMSAMVLGAFDTRNTFRLRLVPPLDGCDQPFRRLAGIPILCSDVPVQQKGMSAAGCDVDWRRSNGQRGLVIHSA